MFFLDLDILTSSKKEKLYMEELICPIKLWSVRRVVSVI
ncbi:MAG: hypothetical protein K0R34_4184, partial [Herbinix sp.]|nr:hypothetical protein [Herbinix sp.]